MSKQSGLIKWEIHRSDDGGYTDIIYWESEEDAKRAEADMVNIPNANDWISCYEDGSISSRNLNQVGQSSVRNSLSRVEQFRLPYHTLLAWSAKSPPPASVSARFCTPQTVVLP